MWPISLGFYSTAQLIRISMRTHSTAGAYIRRENVFCARFFFRCSPFDSRSRPAEQTIKRLWWPSIIALHFASTLNRLEEIAREWSEREKIQHKIVRLTLFRFLIIISIFGVRVIHWFSVYSCFCCIFQIFTSKRRIKFPNLRVRYFSKSIQFGCRYEIWFDLRWCSHFRCGLFSATQNKIKSRTWKSSVFSPFPKWFSVVLNRITEHLQKHWHRQLVLPFANYLRARNVMIASYRSLSLSFCLARTFSFRLRIGCLSVTWSFRVFFMFAPINIL